MYNSIRSESFSQYAISSCSKVIAHRRRFSSDVLPVAERPVPKIPEVGLGGAASAAAPPLPSIEPWRTDPFLNAELGPKPPAF
jgi:hypothetical protein